MAMPRSLCCICAGFFICVSFNCLAWASVSSTPMLYCFPSECKFVHCSSCTFYPMIGLFLPCSE